MIKFFSWLISLVLPGAIVAYLAARLNWRGVRLAYYFSGMTQIDIAVTPDHGPIRVYIHSITIKNNGNQPAEDLDISHYYLPENIGVFPSLQYEIIKDKIIRFSTLAPKEFVTISYLYLEPRLPQQIHEYVRSKNATATFVPMFLNPILPKSLTVLLLILSLCGLIGIGFVAWRVPAVIARLAALFEDPSG